MKIITLIENSPGIEDCCFEHGLSFYIETNNHKLLMDTGASDAIIRNSEILRIDLKSVDSVFLSHGHYDHSGGILTFSEINPTAKIYMQRTATNIFYHGNGERYIGINPKIAALPQTTFVDGNLKLDEELSLFSNISGRRFWAEGNLNLKRLENDTYLQDEFEHEQCLVITDSIRKILISGCAHNGILNILDEYHKLYGDFPHMVISGFHMMKNGEYSPEETDIIKSTAKELSTMNTIFYTGHCTSEKAYDIMKEIMGEQLHALHTGLRIL